MTLETVSSSYRPGLTGHRKVTQSPCQRPRVHGTTLIELVISVSIMTVVIGAMLPLISSARRSCDASQNNAETLQNGRILMDHMTRWLAQAATIESVSSSGTTLGYIDFTDHAENTYRYKVNGANQVQFGEVGSLATLAGPVAKLQLSCYDGNDLSSPITDVNEIRLIKIEAEFINSGELTQNQTFETSVFINADQDQAITDFIGWWCMDDGSGTTAADSSGMDNHGTLHNMYSCWTQGIFSGALEFDGNNDYVDCGTNSTLDITDEITVSTWVKTSDCGNSEHNPYVMKGDHSYGLKHRSDNSLEFFIYDGNWYSAAYAVDSSFNDTWHHVAGTYDGSTVKLYIDGELKATNSHTGSIDVTDYDLNMGRNSENTSRLFNGLLDDVRLYGRALTAEEIAAMASIVWFEEFEEAKASVNATSLTIPTPGGAGSSSTTPVEFLGLGSNDGLSCSALAGANRLLVFTAHGIANSDMSLESVTYGGQPMTKIKEELAEKHGRQTYMALFILDEAGISNASHSTFSPSWGTSPGDSYLQYASCILANVNQSAPIGEIASNSDTRGTQISTDPLGTQDGDLAMAFATASGIWYYVPDNGFSRAKDIWFSSGYGLGIAAGKYCNGNDVTPGFYAYYAANPSPQVIIGVVVQAAPSVITTINGDLLIAAVATDSEETISAPSGEDWTLLSLETSAANAVTLGVWAKLADSSEPATHTFTWTTSEQAYGWIMRFTGHDPSNPLDVMSIAGGGGTSSPPSPSVLTTVDNTLILRIGGFDEDDVTIDDTGMTNHITITMDRSDASSNGASGGAAYMYQALPGTSSSYNFTLTGNEEYRTVTIAIAPEVPSP